MIDKNYKFSKYDPLNAADSEKQTFGCRCYNPDICAGYGSDGICAFYSSDHICRRPPKGWAKTYQEHKEWEIELSNLETETEDSEETFADSKVVVHTEQELNRMPLKERIRIIDSIINLWGNLEAEPSVVVFRNINTGKFVKMYVSPIEQYGKYKKCYGKISADGYSYSVDTMQIFYADCREWILLWYKIKKKKH